MMEGCDRLESIIPETLGHGTCLNLGQKKDNRKLPSASVPNKGLANIKLKQSVIAGGDKSIERNLLHNVGKQEKARSQCRTLLLKKKPLSSYKIALEDTEDYNAMRISKQKEEPSKRKSQAFLTRLTQPTPLQNQDLIKEDACLFIRYEYYLP